MTDVYGTVKTRVGTTAGGRYRIVRLLGSGGMGEVYEAQHTKIGRRFAIKFLHPAFASNTEIMARFQREAESAGALENENIAAVVDFGAAEDGAPYLVMEYLDGEDLAHLLVRTGPLPVPRSTYAIIQACRGLAAAHARGIVHRDLKPENIFVCKRGDGSDLVKVLDFGIAKLHTGGTGLTQTGTTMGTPYYMSLEQARGAKDVDHRTDVYALGVILYEILSGAKPHPGDSYNEILYHVITKQPAPLESVRPGLPPGLAEVVSKAMACEAGNRYPSVSELMAALIPFAGRVVTPLRSQVGIAVSAGNTIPSPVSLPVMAVSGPGVMEKPKSADGGRGRRRALAIGATVIVGGLAILGLWRTLGRSSGPPIAPLVRVTQEGSPVRPARIPVPSAVPTAGDAAVPDGRIDIPPESPAGRPPGQLPRKNQGQAAAVKAHPSKPSGAQPIEKAPIPPAPRSRPTRSIDRENPFAD